MAFDITPYIHQTPAQVRAAIRRGEIDFPTAGMCAGYAQANLVILPPEYALVDEGPDLKLNSVQVNDMSRPPEPPKEG